MIVNTQGYVYKTIQIMLRTLCYVNDADMFNEHL